MGIDTYPSYPWPGYGKGSTRMVPVFTCVRLVRPAPSFAPMAPVGTPQTIPHRLLPTPGWDRQRTRPIHHFRVRHDTGPISARFADRFHVTRVLTLVPLVCPLTLLTTRRAIWQY